MKHKEHAVVFECETQQLVGIIHRGSSTTGVLIVVGGPQYRIGSHRQFLLLGRFLSANEVPVMRFDYRGMGDSEGDISSFEKVDVDIQSAIDAFFKNCPGLESVVLWGLCDAATASSFYAFKDKRVGGLVLLNPWVRTDSGQAEAYVKHYYFQRLVSKDLWRKVFQGRFKVVASIRSFLELFISMCKGKLSSREHGLQEIDANLPLPERLLKGLQQFDGNILFVLSGNDLVADEFRHVTQGSSEWKALMNKPEVSLYELKGANHTFSKQTWRNEVNECTLQWLSKF